MHLKSIQLYTLLLDFNISIAESTVTAIMYLNSSVSLVAFTASCLLLQAPINIEIKYRKQMIYSLSWKHLSL